MHRYILFFLCVYVCLSHCIPFLDNTLPFPNAKTAPKSNFHVHNNTCSSHLYRIYKLKFKCSGGLVREGQDFISYMKNWSSCKWHVFRGPYLSEWLIVQIFRMKVPVPGRASQEGPGTHKRKSASFLLERTMVLSKQRSHFPVRRKHLRNSLEVSPELQLERGRGIENMKRKGCFFLGAGISQKVSAMRAG